MLLEFTDHSDLDIKGLTLIDFWSPWCKPCNMLSPIIKNLAEKNEDITIGKLNTMENPALTKKFNINAIPTILFFKDGVLVRKLLGYSTEAKLQEHINELK